MPSALGEFIRQRRIAADIGLRELARRIGKSPSFITILENDDNPPSASEDTLAAIARELKVEPAELITLAGKTPQEVAPSSALEVALYRQVKRLSEAKKQELLRSLEDTGR